MPVISDLNGFASVTQAANSTPSQHSDTKSLRRLNWNRADRCALIADIMTTDLVTANEGTSLCGNVTTVVETLKLPRCCE